MSRLNCTRRALSGAREGAAPAALLIVLCAILATLPARAATRPAPSFRHAVAVMPDPVAAQVALDTLRAGGNAVDAAVAAGFALAVTYPRAGNIGGGGFMTVRLADGSAYVIDYRETAPAAATRDMFLDDEGNARPELSRQSWLAVGVPGTVAGLALAREKGGTLPLARLLAPAIDLAENGFAVPEGLARSLESYSERLARHPSSARIFLPGGKAPRAGEVLVQKDLARTLRLIAEGGPDAFYKGGVAADLEAAMKKHGGILTAADMAGYRALVREPIRFTYRGLEILSVPPPSAGGVLLAEMFHMLEPHDLGSLGSGSSAYLHLLTEVMKRAYADRAAFLGDPAFFDVPVAALTSPAYARQRMESFDPDHATPAPDAGPGDPSRFEHPSTTQFTIADAAGNVVSNTYTLNGSYGIGEILEGRGFLLNNEMDDFSARPSSPNMYGLVGGEANAVAPGKRMLSSMSPTIVLKEGKPYMALGTPGGGRITTMVLQVILNVVDFGMELQAAVDAPRCHHQWAPDTLFCEREALPADVEANLVRRGHTVKVNGPRGDIQAILYDAAGGRIFGASDARGYGVALGY